MELAGEEEDLEKLAEEQENLVSARALPFYRDRYTTNHMESCRIARFSPDGLFAASGGSDCAIKVFQVPNMHLQRQIKGEQAQDFQTTRPVLRQLKDNTEPINDLAFHPFEQILAACSQDRTIKLFDYNKNASKSVQMMGDTYNVRSIDFHPSGDFLLAASNHPGIRCYDMNTLQAYVSPEVKHAHRGPINQVRYSPNAKNYASAGKDGSIKLWDTISNKCLHTIPAAHSRAEVCSVQFSPSGKFLLSGGKDSVARLWDLSMGKEVMRYEGAAHKWKRLQAALSHTGDHVLSTDERDFSVVAWDTRTGELVKRIRSGHSQVVRCVAPSPTEHAFLTCGEDARCKFWSATVDGEDDDAKDDADNAQMAEAGGDTDPTKRKKRRRGRR